MLAPNPRTTQWIETALKLSASATNMGKLSKNHFTSASVKDCIVAAWYHGTTDKSSRNSGNEFWLARPLTRPNFVALRQIVCEISVVKENFAPRKNWPKCTIGHQICHQSPIDRPYTSFYRHSVVTLASFHRYRWFFIAFVHTPHLLPKIWRRSPWVRSMSSVVQWARSLG